MLPFCCFHAGILAALGVLIGLAMCLGAALRSGDRRDGRWRRALGVLSVSCAVGLAAFVVLEPELRAERYVPDVARASEPLIAALRAFERERGVPPRSLGELVPEFIDAIPATDYRVDREFHYRSYPGGEWLLWVDCESFALDCDVMQYRSTDPTWKFVIVR